MNGTNFTDLSHNPMTKNLILGTRRWGQGIGALGKWGVGEKTPEISEMIRPTEMRAKLSQGKTLRRLPQRSNAPALQLPVASRPRIRFLALR